MNKNLATVPTTGSNIVTIQRANEGDLPPDTVNVREIGGESSGIDKLTIAAGSMSPIWKNMVESGKTQILYCVDSSAPERIGAATINLIELLHTPALQAAPVLIVFTKADMKSSRFIIISCIFYAAFWVSTTLPLNPSV